MSRIGKMPVPLPQGVSVNIQGRTITAKGPKGTLSREFPLMVTFEASEKEIVVSRVNDSKPARARHGLSRSLLNNLVLGVSVGFQKKLTLVGVGNKAELKGKTLVLHLGYSHPIKHALPVGISVKVEKATGLTVSGIDKCS